MTFYNIIFALLFLDACRQLLLLSGSVSGWTAATIAMLIFNDAVQTSQVMEGSGAAPYKLSMKLIDLCNFILLSLSLIALNPDDNPWGVKPAPPLAHTLQTQGVIWWIIVIYWVLAVVWNHLAGLYQRDEWSRWVKIFSHSLVFPFLIMAIFASDVVDSEIPLFLRVIVFACPTIYFLILKPLGRTAS